MMFACNVITPESAAQAARLLIRSIGRSANRQKARKGIDKFIEGAAFQPVDAVMRRKYSEQELEATYERVQTDLLANQDIDWLRN